MEKEEHPLQAEYSGKQLAILQAAEELIAGQGFDGTSVRDIAQRAGVNVAMISYYFGSKDKLLEAIIAYRISVSRSMLEGLLNNKELSPLEKINVLADNYVERMMEHPHYHKIILRGQIAHTDDQSGSVIGKMKFRNLQIVKGIIAEGIRKKVFCKSVDVPLLLATIFGSFYYVLSNQGFYRHAWNMDALTDQAFEVQLRKKLKSHLKHILLSSLTYEA